MILSVPEGDDKPLKYPGVFQASEAVILNKVDTMEVFDFNEQAFRDAVAQLNPVAPIFPISATKGEGVDAWADWLRAKVEAAVPARAASSVMGARCVRSPRAPSGRIADRRPAMPARRAPAWKAARLCRIRRARRAR